MKKKLILWAIISTSLFYGCVGAVDENIDFIPSTKDIVENQNNDEKNETIINTFSFLDYSYNVNKDIKTLPIASEIYNRDNYVRCEYLEIDFAYDLITNYLQGNQKVYEFLLSEDESGNSTPINESDKSRLIKSLDFLRSQMGGAAEDPVYFILNNVVYQGEENGGIVLRVKGNISLNQDYYPSLSDFTVTVYKESSTLKAVIL